MGHNREKKVCPQKSNSSEIRNVFTEFLSPLFSRWPSLCLGASPTLLMRRASVAFSYRESRSEDCDGGRVWPEDPSRSQFGCNSSPKSDFYPVLRSNIYLVKVSWLCACAGSLEQLSLGQSRKRKRIAGRTRTRNHQTSYVKVGCSVVAEDGGYCKHVRLSDRPCWKCWKFWIYCMLTCHKKNGKWNIL